MVKGYPEKIVEVQINGVPEIGHEEKSKTSDQSHPILQSKMIPLFVFGLTFV